MFAALVCCVSGLGFQAMADHEGENHRCWTDQNGGTIHGSEGFEAYVALVPTDNAPAGAAGVARIEAENEEGNVSAVLSLRVQGLPDGDYSVQVTRTSDGSVVEVGTLTLGASASGGGENQNGDQQGEESGSAGGNGFEVQLPADLDPTDIAQIGVVDSSGTLLLAGAVTSGSSTVQYKGSVRLKAGPGAPHAYGQASAQSWSSRGKAFGHYSLQAAGVPANSTFYVTLNGKIVSRARSGPKGRVILQNVPAQQKRIRSMGLLDMRGRTVVGAHF